MDATAAIKLTLTKPSLTVDKPATAFSPDGIRLGCEAASKETGTSPKKAPAGTTPKKTTVMPPPAAKTPTETPPVPLVLSVGRPVRKVASESSTVTDERPKRKDDKKDNKKEEEKKKSTVLG